MKLIGIEPPTGVKITIVLGLLTVPNCWSSQDASAIGSNLSCKELETTIVSLIAVGRLTDAEALMATSVSAGKSTCSGLILAEMAAAANLSRRPADAEVFAERSIKLLEIENALDAPILLQPLLQMCVASLDSGHIANARRAYDRMLQIRSRTAEQIYLVHTAAARLLDHQQKFKDAETELLAAIDALHNAGLAGGGDEVALLQSLTLLLASQRRYGEARATMERASAMFELATDVHPIDRVDLSHTRAIVHAQTGEWGKAEQDLREAIAVADKGTPMDPAFLRTLLLRHAEALRHIHRRRDARTVQKRALSLVAPSSANALVDASELYSQAGIDKLTAKRERNRRAGRR